MKEAWSAVSVLRCGAPLDSDQHRNWQLRRATNNDVVHDATRPIDQAMSNAEVVRHHDPCSDAEMQSLAQCVKHVGPSACRETRLDANGVCSLLLDLITQLPPVDLVAPLSSDD
jgi:hypothetical protein